MPVLQSLKPRDGPVVTLTLSNPSATSVAYVTLGQGSPSLSSSASPETLTTTSSMAPTTVAPSPAGGNNSSGLTQDQIGAILGSIVGFIVVLLMIWFCCGSDGRGGGGGRRDRWYGSRYSSSSSGSGRSSSSSSTDRRRRRSRRRSRRRNTWTRHQPTVRVREYVAGPSPWKLNPPPPRFPPTARTYGFNHTPNPQIRGVRRYP